MRKCCCCIPILGGATFLGLIALALCALEFVVTIPFLFDIETFNPLKENINYFYIQVDYVLQNFTSSPEQKEDIMKEIHGYTWSTVLGEAISTGVYFLLSLLMIIGIHCDMRGLMIPYMVIQMLYIILGITIGVGVTVLFFFYKIIMGIVCAAVVLIMAFFFIYYWIAVQKVSIHS